MPDGSVAFVAPRVPSLGYRSFAVTKGAPQAATPRSGAAATALENRYYRIAFDPATGTIPGIRDKRLNVELVDQAAPHRFNEYLYERFETRDWNVPAAWHRVSAAALEASSGPVAETMQVRARAVGVESLVQTVILYRELERIDFVLDLVKAPSGRRDYMPNVDPRYKESVYVALPFAVPEHPHPPRVAGLRQRAGRGPLRWRLHGVLCRAPL